MMIQLRWGQVKMKRVRISVIVRASPVPASDDKDTQGKMRGESNCLPSPLSRGKCGVNRTTFRVHYRDEDGKELNGKLIYPSFPRTTHAMPPSPFPPYLYLQTAESLAFTHARRRTSPISFFFFLIYYALRTYIASMWLNGKK
jgi:hypothetical protein